MSVFVTPVTTRITLPCGEWIEVAERLGIGAKKRVDTAGLRHVDPAKPGAIEVDFSEFSLARTCAYLKDWSFKDDQNRPVKVSRAAVEALDEEIYNEIETAITVHVEAMAARKKTLGGEPASRAS